MNKEIVLSDKENTIERELVEGGTSELGILVEIKDSGPSGPQGKPPKHEWLDNSKIRFQNPDGSWGEFVDLVKIKDLDYNSLRNKPSIGGVELRGGLGLGDVGADVIRNEDIKKLM